MLNRTLRTTARELIRSAAFPRFAAMSTVRINGVDVPVVAATPAVEPDLPKVLAAKIFHEWAAGMDPELNVKEVAVQGVDMFGPRVGFIKFSASVEFHGKRVPGIVFMRGGGENRRQGTGNEGV
jgi:hypothetical protein